MPCTSVDEILETEDAKQRDKKQHEESASDFAPMVRDLAERVRRKQTSGGSSSNRTRSGATSSASSRASDKRRRRFPSDLSSVDDNVSLDMLQDLVTSNHHSKSAKTV